MYYNRQDSFIIPVFNIVIKLTNGTISDIVWDNDCYSCNINDNCYNNNSTSYTNDTNIKVTYKNCKQQLCKNTREESFKCDPKFYITWFGTDANGKQLQSSNLSMSRFRMYSIGSLYVSARDAFNSTLNTLTATWESVKNKTSEIFKGETN